jgi:hypothetical protein
MKARFEKAISQFHFGYGCVWLWLFDKLRQQGGCQ